MAEEPEVLELRRGDVALVNLQVRDAGLPGVHQVIDVPIAREAPPTQE